MNDVNDNQGQESALATLPAAQHRLEQLAHGTARLIAQAQAERTQRAYASDFRQFEAWCAAHGMQSLPAVPGMLGLYVTELVDQGKKVSTIERRLVAVRHVHQVAGYEDPTANVAVRQAMKGTRRQLGTAQKKAAPLLVDALKATVATLDLSRLKDLRDRALLCLGFASALRRSELVALQVEDLEFIPEGVRLTIRRSKTDQEGAGRSVVVMNGKNGTCPVAATKAWLSAAGLQSGPVFVSVDRHGRVMDKAVTDQVVRLVVKERLEAAGIDPAPFSGHSLRAGLATAAALAGAEERDIAKQTGHKSSKILRGYIREADLLRNNVSANLGL